MQQVRNASLVETVSQNKKKEEERNRNTEQEEDQSEEEEDSIISLKAAGHLSSNNVAAHLVVVRTGWHWSTAFEARGKSPDQYTAETAN